MVYTLTLNPALDYIVKIDEINLGQTNRSIAEEHYPGGKGLNVSRILNELGIENRALGYIAGFTGVEIKKLSRAKGVITDFIQLKEGNNRINIKIKSQVETEINGQGPIISEKEGKELFNKLDELNNNDYLILAGSIPSSLGNDFYKKIMIHLKDKNINVVVDATGESLKNTLELNPLLIKPNISELEEIIAVKLKDSSDIYKEIDKIRDLGAKNIIISMGKDGAILIEENGEITEAKAPQGKVINTVGSGDSMVAGFIGGLIKGQSNKEAFKLSLACGSATAFSHDLASKEKIDEVIKSIKL